MSTRRARAAIDALAEYLPEVNAGKCSKAIRRVTTALGEVRDFDVQLAAVDDFRRRKPLPGYARGLDWLRTRIERQRAAAQKRVTHAVSRLERERTIPEMTRALAWSARRASSSKEADDGSLLFHQALVKILPRLKELLSFDSRAVGSATVDEFHAMRIAAKKLRYTMEVFAPVYGESLNPFIKVSRKIQDYLGKIHDCDVWLGGLIRILALKRFEPAGPATREEREGVEAFRSDREKQRESLCREFRSYWRQLKRESVWGAIEELVRVSSGAGVEADRSGGGVLRPVLRLAERCRYDREHAFHVRFLALRLFDELLSVHRLGGRERHWLESGALLHDIGWVKGQRAHHKEALNIILESTFLHMDKRERLLLGSIVRYHRRAHPSMKHPYYARLGAPGRRTVRRLAALLRVADALDHTHRKVVEDLSCKAAEGVIYIRCDVNQPALQEVQAARRKSLLFEEEFKCRLDLGCRRK